MGVKGGGKGSFRLGFRVPTSIGSISPSSFLGAKGGGQRWGQRGGGGKGSFRLGFRVPTTCVYKSSIKTHSG